MAQNLEDDFAYQDTGNAHINNDVIGQLYGSADLTSPGNSSLIKSNNSAQSADGSQTGLPIVMVFEKKTAEVGPPVSLANPDNGRGRDPSDRLPGEPPPEVNGVPIGPTPGADLPGTEHSPTVRRGGGRTAPFPVAG